MIFPVSVFLGTLAENEYEGRSSSLSQSQPFWSILALPAPPLPNQLGESEGGVRPRKVTYERGIKQQSLKPIVARVKLNLN